jgi:hypothetical protein
VGSAKGIAIDQRQVINPTARIIFDDATLTVARLVPLLQGYLLAGQLPPLCKLK